MKKVMIAGMGGQLGFELEKTLPENIELVAPTEIDLDITNRESVQDFVTRESPAIIVNSAAYTQVDKAESEPEKAFAVNQMGPKHLAEAALACGALLVHVSTDFVFDGCSSRLYRSDDASNPLSIYGKSKLAGENEVLASGAEAIIVRTSWLYSSHGNNFVKTMLRLMTERDSIGVVSDQIGTPTWANSLANLIWLISATDFRGILHWSDAGVASWYDFATAIYEEAHKIGLLKKLTEVKPINTIDYPTPAQRPAFSVMDKSLAYKKADLRPVHWRANLIKCLHEIELANTGKPSAVRSE